SSPRTCARKATSPPSLIHPLSAKSKVPPPGAGSPGLTILEIWPLAEALNTPIPNPTFMLAQGDPELGTKFFGDMRAIRVSPKHVDDYINRRLEAVKQTAEHLAAQPAQAQVVAIARKQ